MRKPRLKEGPCCLLSDCAVDLDVSRCMRHGTIEIHVNGKMYALSDGQARELARALNEALDHGGD